MSSPFAAADWAVSAAYLLLLVGGGWLFTPRRTDDTRAYFLASRSVPPWLAAVSVLSATQSAATFLGAPDNSYRGDLTYLGSSLGALLGAVVVARVLIPRLYALDAATAYELLAARFGSGAMRCAGGSFLAGRVLAGGARVYLAAIAIAMAATGGAGAGAVIGAAAALMAASLVFTVAGGLRSVLWNDLVQFAVFLIAALAVLVFLRLSIPASNAELIRGLADAPGGTDKLRLVDPSFDLAKPFALPAILTGVALLTVANAGMDQDTTQRLLACRDARAGARGLYGSVLAGAPVVAIFLAIGLLLHVRYQRPDLMGGAVPAPGATTGIFMHYILTELPAGLRGLVTVGVVAAAVATTNSALNAMASVAVQDFYRPWRESRGGADERHYVAAGRAGMALTALAMLAAAVLSLWWQRASALPLLEFALQVMVFAYAGLIGVYATAVFTRRGTTGSVIAALVAGFATVLALQPAIAAAIGLPTGLAFPWQLCVGALVAFLVCATPAGVGGLPRGDCAGQASR